MMSMVKMSIVKTNTNKWHLGMERIEMAFELEKEISEELNQSGLQGFATYLGVDPEDLEELYSDIDFDDYS
jgi:hypothetical protein